MVEVWYLSEEDKEQIKSYSEKISVLFKIRGYSPRNSIDCFFTPDEFSFIPCIKEWIEFNGIHDFKYNQEVVDAINSAYDPSVKITLKDFKELEDGENTLEDLILNRLNSNSDLLDFLYSCDDVTEKFLNWAFK